MGHGRGDGKGQVLAIENRKRTSADAKLNEASPAKNKTETTQVLMLEWKDPGVIAKSEGSGAQKKLAFERDEAGKYAPRSGTPPPPPPPPAREQKRPKKHSTPKKKTVSSAGSSEEYHREQ
jgi:hypothetical protein